jgi:hypothetical protein
MISKDSVIIVLAHANNEWRKHLLKECISKLNGEIILSTNYPSDFETQTMCDWVVYSKKNEILPKEDFSKYNVLFNFWHYDEDNNYHEIPFEFDHGYAVYTLIRNGVKLAKQLGKTKIHIINYDYELFEDVFTQNDEELNSHDLVCYRYDNDFHNVKNEPCYCTGLMSGRIESFDKYLNTFNSISEYYSNRITFNQTLEAKTYGILTTNGDNILEKEFSTVKGLIDRDYILSTNASTNRFREIGLKYGCDKVSRHKYHELYPNIFEKFKTEDINLFEIGIDEGKSLKVWKEYYPNSNVFGLDIQSEIINDEVTIFKGDQTNLNDLSNIINQIPKCDIIIDDGSHVAEHQLKTFYYLFENLLKDGGTYIIEDVECSYWKPTDTIYGYETGHLNLIDYFTKLNHQVNSHYNSIENKLNIKKITYSPNCIIIEKIK